MGSLEEVVNNGIIRVFLHLTHCGLVTPFGDKELCPHWLR